MKMSDITPLQWIGVIILFNTTLLGSASQLGDLSLSAGAVKAILAIATLGNGFLGGLVTMFGSQQSMKNAVGHMDQTTVVTTRASANALPNNEAVIAATPEIIAAIKKAGVILFALMIGWSLMPANAYAQDAVLKRIVSGNAAAATSSSGAAGVPRDLLGALDEKILPDLQYAKAMADATGSKVTGGCYGAWISIILSRQQALKGTDGQAISQPEPHLISDFERAVELRNALQPTSDFSIACSPVANMIKKDILSFIGVVMGGGAGLSLLGIGL